jgi:hypothetical protein
MSGTSDELWRDLYKSGGRFALYEIVVPVVIFMVSVGMLNVVNIQPATLVSFLPVVIGLVIGLALIGSIVVYWEELLGIGILAGAVILVAGLFFVGLQQFVGSFASQSANLLVKIVTGILTIVLLLVVLAVILLIVAAVALPFVSVFSVYLELYEHVRLHSPSLWIVPPVIGICCAVVLWATFSGNNETLPLFVLFLTVSSLALRSGFYAHSRRGGDDSILPLVPQWAISGSLSAAVLLWGLHLHDPGMLKDIRPVLEDSYRLVELITPFTAGGDVAAVSSLLPGLLVSAVVVAVHAPRHDRIPEEVPSLSLSGNPFSGLDLSNDRESSSGNQSSTSSTASSTGETEVYNGSDNSSTDTKIYTPDNEGDRRQ